MPKDTLPEPWVVKMSMHKGRQHRLERWESLNGSALLPQDAAGVRGEVEVLEDDLLSFPEVR